jgi:hypothetical protein
MPILTTSQNLRVIASYYSRITMTRLTELLDLPPLTTERTICKLVTDKTIYARIDRPAGIVSFKQTKGVNEVLNAWSGDIAKMLSLVEKTSHLVAKVSWGRWWESASATTALVVPRREPVFGRSFVLDWTPCAACFAVCHVLRASCFVFRVPCSVFRVPCFR